MTFVSVPGAVFRDGGNLTYLQVIIGLAVGKLFIAALFARAFYNAADERTVYDYIGRRLGNGSGNIAIGLGLLLNVINASVKLLTACLVLEVVTGWTLAECAASVMLFSVIWSGIAGVKTVIWTDLLLFILFAIGAVLILGYLALTIDVRWATIYGQWEADLRLRWLDLSLDPTRSYTLWAALIGSIGLSIALGGTQATWQRIKACRSAGDAQRAYGYAALFYALHLVVLAVGLGLVAFYEVNPPLAEQAAALAEKPDRVLPIFILNELPVGLSGLLLAALFAAAISTLDTALAEATDITARHLYEPLASATASESTHLLVSRLILVFWAVLFTFAAIGASRFDGDGLLDLTFKLPNYLYGTTFGLILLARYPRLRAGRELSVGAVVIGIAAASVTVYLLQLGGIAFFWWCPASGAVMIASVRACQSLTSQRRPAPE